MDSNIYIRVASKAKIRTEQDVLKLKNLTVLSGGQII